MRSFLLFGEQVVKRTDETTENMKKLENQEKRSGIHGGRMALARMVAVFGITFFTVLGCAGLVNANQEKRRKNSGGLYRGVHRKPGGVTAQQISGGVQPDEAYG